jgi:hypothetical protein
MTDHKRIAGTFHGAKIILFPRHKFPVGARVAHPSGPPGRMAIFEVTRHLPDGGQGLQYRIRCEEDGRERVATETTLAAASAGLLD